MKKLEEDVSSFLSCSATDTSEKLSSQSCRPGQIPVNNTLDVCVCFCMSTLNGFEGIRAYSSHCCWVLGQGVMVVVVVVVAAVNDMDAESTLRQRRVDAPWPLR